MTRHDANGGKVVSGIFAANPGAIHVPTNAQTLHVLEGAARVKLETGEAADLTVGDFAVLPHGHLATSTFHSPYREIFLASGVD